MNLRHILSPGPLLVAAVIGAVGLGVIRRRGWSDLWTGAALGAAVQVGVRALGVS